MTAKLLFVVACLLAVGRSALVKRDAPTPLQDFEKHASEFAKTFSEQLNSFINSKNTQEVQEALKTGSESVLNQLSVLSTSLQGAIGDASGKAKEALEQSKANIERAAEDLRKSHPEVEQQATALKDKLQAAVQNAVQETQKLAKTVSENMEATNQKVAPQIEAAYNDFVKQVQTVQKNLHEAANKQ